MKICGDTKLRLATGISYQSFGEGEDGVILSLNSGYLYACNPTALLFLEGLDGCQTFGQLVDRFASKCTIERDRAYSDLASLTETLLEEKVLEPLA